MDYSNLCYRCFAEIPIPGRPCPVCGHKNSEPQLSPLCLPVGTTLAGRYIVGCALGMGGFGITYKCMDVRLGGICAIKEYFPTVCATRARDGRTVIEHNTGSLQFGHGMQRFTEEAKLLRGLHHRNIIETYDYFAANNTVYYVMEYCDGIDLRSYTDNFHRSLTYEQGMNILEQVMDGLEYVHSQGVLHRDIAPDNIYITRTNMVKILDFGAARREMTQFSSGGLSIIVKAGYAPIEQHTRHIMQSTYTDIYALGATMYHIFSGQMPLESLQRQGTDRLIPLSRLRPDLPRELTDCIEGAMALNPQDRIQTIADMRRILFRRRESSSSAPRRVRRASVGVRFGAWWIDSLICALPFVAISLFAGLSATAVAVLFAVVLPIVSTLVNMAEEMIFSASAGKAMLGLTVVSSDSSVLRASQAAVRNIVKLLNIFVLIFAKNGALLEDRASDSMVVYRR